MSLLMLAAAWVAGIFVGVQWAEAEVVRERVRAAWRRGFTTGATEATRASVLLATEGDAEAVERLIRETRG